MMCRSVTASAARAKVLAGHRGGLRLLSRPCEGCGINAELDQVRPSRRSARSDSYRETMRLT
jgi:hypothetical protein